jgi:hypothetical protein
MRFLQNKIYLMIFIVLMIILMIASSFLLYDYFPTTLLLESSIILGGGIAITIAGMLTGFRIPIGHGGTPPPTDDEIERKRWLSLAGMVLIVFGVISLVIAIIFSLL